MATWEGWGSRGQPLTHRRIRGRQRGVGRREARTRLQGACAQACVPSCWAGVFQKTQRSLSLAPVSAVTITHHPGVKSGLGSLGGRRRNVQRAWSSPRFMHLVNHVGGSVPPLGAIQSLYPGNTRCSWTMPLLSVALTDSVTPLQYTCISSWQSGGDRHSRPMGSRRKPSKGPHCGVGFSLQR